MMGIYLITNQINGNRYVGMTNNIKRRFMEHRTPRNIANRTTVLARAFRKYSIVNFSFQVIEEVKHTKELIDREAYWIETLSPEYNMNEGGLGNPGHVLSNELKNRLSQISKKQWNNKSETEKEQIIQNNLTGPRKGHGVSRSTREKLRKANLGKPQSEETRKKRSQKLKVSAIGNKNGNKMVASYKDGSLVKVFESIKIAAEELGIHPSRITAVLKGRRNKTAGYSWSYWSVETNRDECSGVGTRINHVSKREASQVDEDIVQPLAIGKLGIADKAFIQLALRSGQYKTINATEVYEGELVEFNRITGMITLDEKSRTSDKVIGYAAYFQLMNGFEKTLFMTVDDLMAHGKKYSKSFNNGQWKDNPHVMMMKTVIKLLLSKYGILSVQLQTAMQADQAVITETEDGEVKFDYEDNPEAEEVEAEEVPEETNWEVPSSVIKAIESIQSIEEYNKWKKDHKKQLEAFGGKDAELIGKTLEETESKLLKG